eukprot:6185312-Pleurochrysis_carterae.AAC.4
MAGKSVFQLSYEEAAYNSDCWQIMMYMLVFVMIVDTTQRLVGRFAEGDRVTEMFVSRLESELLMFGAIALVVFFLDQGLNPLVLSDKMYKLVKFADIIVSIAAILLIVVGCWAYLLLLRARRHYHQLTVRRIAEYAHPEERAETSIYHECWRKLGYGKRLQEDIDFLVGAGPRHTTPGSWIGRVRGHPCLPFITCQHMQVAFYDEPVTHVSSTEELPSAPRCNSLHCLHSRHSLAASEREARSLVLSRCPTQATSR